MSVVIVTGAGRVGYQVATLLSEGGHDVRVVERDPYRSAEIDDRFGAGTAVTGSATDAATLERAGVRDCDVVVTLTGSDETNLVVSSLARFEFGVPRVIARIVDPAHAWLFQSDMGVDVALNQADLLAHIVAEEMSLGEMTILLKLRRGQYALVEEKVEPGSPVEGRAVGEIQWPARCRLIAILRGGELLVPEPAIVMEEGDEVLALSHSDAEADLALVLAAGPARGSRGEVE